MTAFIEKRKPQIVAVEAAYGLTSVGIQILTEQFNTPLPKRKPQGFNKRQ